MNVPTTLEAGIDPIILTTFSDFVITKTQHRHSASNLPSKGEDLLAAERDGYVSKISDLQLNVDRLNLDVEFERANYESLRKVSQYLDVDICTAHSA